MEMSDYKYNEEVGLGSLLMPYPSGKNGLYRHAQNAEIKKEEKP